ncbi:GNAT family N-acetyltransferase [Plantactinospora sp. WMMB782]|uniref:GNAT family N-acetyltransferase n=1 Tax=Plantactinospora sp. WMMB782 TaxID=3404121 RepID=UPI003B930E9D
MVRVDVLTGYRELASTAPEWLSLCRSAAAASPYNHPGWVLSWWRQRHRTGLRWRAVTARDARHRLTGILPLVRFPDGTVRFAGYDLHDEAAGLAVDGGLPALWGAATDLLGSRGDCTGLDLPTLASADLAALRGVVAPRRLRVTGLDPGARLDLTGGWDRIFATLPSSRRKRIRAERRALERDHGSVGFDLVTHPGDVVTAAEELWRLREASWRARGRYGELAEHVRGDQLLTFLRELAREPLLAGVLRVARLRAGAVVAAAALQLLVGRRLWYPLCAFAPPLARYGPGRLLLAECAREAAERGCSAFELGRGVERYKFTVGAVRYELPDVTVGRAD